ncbi:MAG: hypothetical protein HRU13_02235 [Phycisphaerales bacterium]|nr:hypothetical protein [Phycisphaerales bacterium]
MSLVPVGQARRIAKERLRSVIRANLQAEIDAAAQASSLTPTPELAGPRPSAVYITDPDQPDKLPRNDDVFVYIYEDGPRTIERSNSGGPLFFKGQTTQDMLIALVHRYQLGPEYRDPDDVVPEADVQLRHMLDLYNAALINCVMRYAKSSDTIHEIELVTDEPIPIYDENLPAFGVVRLTIRITQMVSIPQPDCC